MGLGRRYLRERPVTLPGHVGPVGDGPGTLGSEGRLPWTEPKRGKLVPGAAPSCPGVSLHSQETQGVSRSETGVGGSVDGTTHSVRSGPLKGSRSLPVVAEVVSLHRDALRDRD